MLAIGKYQGLSLVDGALTIHRSATASMNLEFRNTAGIIEPSSSEESKALLILLADLPLHHTTKALK